MTQLNRAVRAAAGAVVLLVGAAIASADPVTILGDLRATSVAAQVNNTTQSDFDTASDRLISTAMVISGPNSTGASASVTSSVADPMHWFGVGTGDAFTMTQSGTAGYQSFATFAIVFGVTSAVEYAFHGLLESSSFVGEPAPPGEGDSIWRFALSRNTGGTSLPLFQEEGRGAAVRSFVGTLAPGEYVLGVQSQIFGRIDAAGTRSARAGYNFTFDLTPHDLAPVPEPASLLLLGTGLAGLFGYGSRARNRR